MMESVRRTLIGNLVRVPDGRLGKCIAIELNGTARLLMRGVEGLAAVEDHHQSGLQSVPWTEQTKPSSTLS